jgi:general secretion pathway protein A
MRQVKQRIAIRMHIDPLAAPEVKRYLQTRWARASTEHAFPFADQAVELVAHASGGIPRVVNVICDAALVNAYGGGIRAIGVTQIEEVLEDLSIVVPHQSVPAGAAAPGNLSGNGSHAAHPAVNRVANPVANPLANPVEGQAAGATRPVERYLPAVQQSPRFWRIATWFRAAGGEAK